MVKIGKNVGAAIFFFVTKKFPSTHSVILAKVCKAPMCPNPLPKQMEELWACLSRPGSMSSDLVAEEQRCRAGKPENQSGPGTLYPLFEHIKIKLEQFALSEFFKKISLALNFSAMN